MTNKNSLKFSATHFFFSIGVVVVIWFLYWCEIRFGKNFNEYGIYPRTLKGLRGIVFSPFIHSGTSHLFNNSIPFLVLFNLLVVFYRDTYLKVLILGGLLTGLMTWVIARYSYHIGLSGIIYLLFSYIFFSGIIIKNFRLISASLIIIFLYGSMIWYILPVKDGMSWEGHLSGFVVGLLFAFLFKKKGLQKENTEFIETEFDLMFDEDGNFIGDKSKEKEP